MTKREALARIAELEARLRGVDVYDVELLRRERDAARAERDALQDRLAGAGKVTITIDEPRCAACGQLGHNCPTGGRLLR